MVWNLIQTTFVQSLLSLVPTLRKSIEASPKASQDLPPSSPEVEPWKEEVNRWKQLSDKTSAERDQLRHEAGQLHVELQKLAQDLDRAKAEAEEGWKAQEEQIQQQNEEIKRRDELVKQREADAQRKELELEKARGELTKLESGVDNLQREKSTIQTLLDSRQVEVEELRLVAGVDGVGEGEVLNLLLKLNNDIAQTAKSTRELFKLDKNTRPNGKVTLEASAAIEGWVGSALPVLLSQQYRGNAVLLQASLQAMAVAFSSWISSSYSFMHEHDQILDETYKYVMNSESQAVLGRWRALTHKYAKQGMPNLADELTKMFVTDVRNLLLVAGASTVQVDNLVNRRRDSFRAIVESAISLRKAIGEDIVSCDYETVLIHPGDAFDGSSMENGYDSTMKESIAKVVCTSAMGLRRCKKGIKTGADGKSESSWDVTILQKPQVVLESSLTPGAV